MPIIAAGLAIGLIAAIFRVLSAICAHGAVRWARLGEVKWERYSRIQSRGMLILAWVVAPLAAAVVLVGIVSLFVA